MKEAVGVKHSNYTTRTVIILMGLSTERKNSRIDHARIDDLCTKSNSKTSKGISDKYSTC